MKYLIKDIKINVGGGFACGPAFGPILAELVLQDEDGDLSYYILAEVDGIPHFYCPERSCIEGMNVFDEDTFDYVDDYLDYDINDYDLVFEADHEDMDNRIYRYLIYMVRADWDDVDTYKAATIGKYMDEIEIPNSDLEDEWLEENEEE